MNLKYHCDRYKLFMDEVLDFILQYINADKEFTSYNGLTQSTMFEIKFIEDLKYAVEDHIEDNEIFLFKYFSSRRLLNSWYTFQANFAHDFLEFEVTGRNIFHIRPFLCELLNHTDLLSLNIKDLNLPYNNFYLYFENQDSVYIDSREYKFEGCYVFSNNSFLQLYLVTNSKNIDYTGNDHVEYLLNEKIIGLMIPYDITDNITIKEYIGSDGNKLALNEWEAEEIAKWKSYLENALSIIICSLYYLSEEKYKDDIEKKHDDKNIKNSVAKESKKKNKIKSKNDIHIIHFCGNKLEKKYGKILKNKSMRPHWRRGHFRNQAYGPNYSSHKRIWVFPVIVLAEKGDVSISHIYKE